MSELQEAIKELDFLVRASSYLGDHEDAAHALKVIKKHLPQQYTVEEFVDLKFEGLCLVQYINHEGKKCWDYAFRRDCHFFFHEDGTDTNLTWRDEELTAVQPIPMPGGE